LAQTEERKAIRSVEGVDPKEKTLDVSCSLTALISCGRRGGSLTPDNSRRGNMSLKTGNSTKSPETLVFR
jgi:hypothetical protein